MSSRRVLPQVSPRQFIRPERTLLPKLLPNSVSRSGTVTDEERTQIQKVPMNRELEGCTGIAGDAVNELQNRAPFRNGN